MTSSVLTITQSGLDACASAQAGGFAVNVTTFKIGNGSTPAVLTDPSMSGTILFTGNVSLVQVLSPGVAQFTLDLIPSSSPYTFQEIGLFLDSGVMFAHGVFSNATTKDADITIRIFAIVAAVNNSLTSLNVTVGDVYSIPSVASVHTLPAPNSSNYNAIAVQDLKYNYDNSSSGSIAVQTGLEWSFLGFSRIFYGNPDSTSGTILNSSVFSILSLNSIYTFTNNELFIVQIISGQGQGESRRVTYSTSTASFTEIDSTPFTSIGATSILSLWRVVDGNSTYAAPGSACAWPPTLTGVPSDWVLTRGINCPTWASPSSVTNVNTGSSGGLFYSPSSLEPTAVYFTGDGATLSFDTGTELTTLNTLVAVSGVTQHKESYDVQNTIIMFTEAPPPGTLIEALIFTNNASTGTNLKFNTDYYTGDGVTTTFALAWDGHSLIPTSAAYLMCYITGFKQGLNSYLYSVNSTGQPSIVFNEAPKSGLTIQVSSIVPIPQANYTTQIVVNSFLASGYLDIYKLSVVPTDPSYVFVYVSGVMLHSDTYTVNGSSVIIPDIITKDYSINIIVFNNILSYGVPTDSLSGVVIGAVATERYLKLQCYNSPELLIPNPRVEFFAGPGIDISGNWPNYTVSSLVASSVTNVPVVRFNTLFTQDNVEEIVYTYKFVYSTNSIVTLTADFCARLGPGFASPEGGEYVEYVLGFRSDSVVEPPYGRRVKGTGTAGFSYLPQSLTAFANASITQSFEMNLSQLPTATVTFVARMRVLNGNVSRYKSQMDINFSLVSVPKTIQFMG